MTAFEWFGVLLIGGVKMAFLAAVVWAAVRLAQRVRSDEERTPSAEADIGRTPADES